MRFLSTLVLASLAVSAARANDAADLAVLSSGNVTTVAALPKKGKASGGAVKLQLSHQGRSLWAIFKPRSGEGQVRGSLSDPQGRALREACVYQLSTALGLAGLVPPTVVRNLAVPPSGGQPGKPAEEGSLQKWVDGPGTVISASTAYDAARKLDVDAWQKALVFDLVIGNFDRNQDNMLAVQIGAAAWKPIAIDNGMAFPPQTAIPDHFSFPWAFLGATIGKPILPSKAALDFASGLDNARIAASLRGCRLPPVAIRGALHRALLLKKNRAALSQALLLDSPKNIAFNANANELYALVNPSTKDLDVQGRKVPVVAATANELAAIQRLANIPQRPVPAPPQAAPVQAAQNGPARKMPARKAPPPPSRPAPAQPAAGQ